MIISSLLKLILNFDLNTNLSNNLLIFLKKYNFILGKMIIFYKNSCLK